MLRVWTTTTLAAVLLSACALVGEDPRYPYALGWRRVKFHAFSTQYVGPAFRDCRLKAGEPFLVFREREKQSRFVTVTRDWLMPIEREIPSDGTVAALNLHSCSAGYELLEHR